MSYKLKVAVKHYEDVSISKEDLIKILEQEKDKISGKWDCIVTRQDGTAYYYNRGYGSHDIGEEDGPDVSPEVLEDYKTVCNMIALLRKQIKEREGK